MNIFQIRLRKVVACCAHNSLRDSLRQDFSYTRLICMDFADAVALVKNFPACHPKIFKGFYEWGFCDRETEGYVILADLASTKEPIFNQLEDYTKKHELRIEKGQEYLIISTLCQDPNR
jgi:hypothetical protein